jgi:hypothetical protein
MFLNFALRYLIPELCIQKLRLRRDHSKVLITGLNMFKTDTTRGKAALNLLFRMDNNVSTSQFIYIVSKITCNLPIKSIDQSVWSTFEALELADPSVHQPNGLRYDQECKNSMRQCNYQKYNF